MRRQENPLYRSVDDRERSASRVLRFPAPPLFVGYLALIAILVYELVAGHYGQLAVIAVLTVVALVVRVKLG